MSTPNGYLTSFDLTYNAVLTILLIMFVVGMSYIFIFHGIPAQEARDVQMHEIKNEMSCGELQEMILERTGLSMQNRAEVKHQYEWRCEK